MSADSWQHIAYDDPYGKPSPEEVIGALVTAFQDFIDMVVDMRGEDVPQGQPDGPKGRPVKPKDGHWFELETEKDAEDDERIR